MASAPFLEGNLQFLDLALQLGYAVDMDLFLHLGSIKGRFEIAELPHFIECRAPDIESFAAGLEILIDDYPEPFSAGEEEISPALKDRTAIVLYPAGS